MNWQSACESLIDKKQGKRGEGVSGARCYDLFMDFDPKSATHMRLVNAVVA
jgi:hypothetical protein